MASAKKCSYCQKVFDTDQKAKRHQYYCKLRQIDPAPPRRRACEACVSAKARCDLDQPCGRCANRKTTCQYAISAHTARRSKTRGPDEDGISTTFVSSSVPAKSLSIHNQSDVSTTATFSRRNTPDVTGESIQQLILTMLSTIMAMFRDGQVASPLIHHSQQQATAGNPLATCRVLLQQFARAPDYRHAQLWECVHREAERIWFEHEAWDEWTIIACLQAMFFYAVLRATSISSPSEDFDLPFLVCMNAVCKSAKRRIEDSREVDHSDPHALGYDAWAVYESCKRIATVYRTLNLVIDISDAVSCIANPGYFIMPLPTREDIWQAGGSAEWERTLIGGEVYGLSLKGDLELFDKSLEVAPAEWNTWCASRGHLGCLVATAALLLQ